MENNYRASVIESLKKIFKDKAYSNLVINNDIKNINHKYDAIYRKSVLGVIENLIFIDWIIDQVSTTKTKKMESEVLFIVRLAVYQLFFLENSHENIVVNESVQYIKEKVNLKVSKFVNAVLRNIIRNRDNIINELNKLPEEDYLSIKYSYPKYLVLKWEKQFGKDKIEDVLIANNSKSPLEIRVNTVKISRDDLMETFEQKGIKTHKCIIAEKGLVIENPSELDKLEEYKKGFFSIQSESSMLAVQVLNPKENSVIVDMCAAPGGKSLCASEMMNNTGKIISRDIYKNKITLINREMKRLGLTNITTEDYDATKLDKSLIEKADFCIVDVPCTGLGIIRRKPEIKYNKTELDIENIHDIQYRILENASRYLKVNGELVYSTCTTNREENINIIRDFLNNNKNYAAVDISAETKNYFDTSSAGYAEIFPHLNDMDGFFIAKIKRI